ncbi:DNA gyrase, subunit B (type II topoisomerase) [Acinetobacter baumannii]|jgi:hypothetical protein|uniref:hypothetical protein n=1 Tax=Acinetobacter baumannii TaxID=470 RepID=UPI000DE653DD|nr:hypothetical protein [Acinetobacter baumannii]SSQ09997.1 DNA gyrase, subunit B (type II topoisomerase) [Acinetobacter baumannii]
MDTPPRTHKEAWLSYKTSRTLKSESGFENSSIRVLRGLDAVRKRPGIYISDAISITTKTFSILNDYSDEIAQTLNELLFLFEKQGIVNFYEFSQFLNSKFLNFSLKGALKLTSASQTIAIYKKLKEITLSVIFTTTRNFSIQKNLSISA